MLSTRKEALQDLEPDPHEGGVGPEDPRGLARAKGDDLAAACDLA